MKINNHESNVQILKDVSSNLISTFCGDMFSFALGLMLLHATGMSLSFGLSMIIMPIVTLIGVVPIGNLVDTYPHKHIFGHQSVRSDHCTFYLCNHYPSFQWDGKTDPNNYILAINYVSVNVSNSGYTASVHELVNTSHIQRLNSLSQAASSFASTFSPVIAASLYVLVGFQSFYYFSISSTFYCFGHPAIHALSLCKCIQEGSVGAT